MTDLAWLAVTIKELGWHDFTAVTDDGWAIPHEVVALLVVGETYLIQTNPDTDCLLVLAADVDGAPGDVLYERPVTEADLSGTDGSAP